MPRSRTLPKVMGRWISLRQLHALWDRSGAAPALRTLRYWCQHGQLPGSKRGGGDWRVDMGELKASDEGRAIYEDIVRAVNERGL